MKDEGFIKSYFELKKHHRSTQDWKGEKIYAEENKDGESHDHLSCFKPRAYVMVGAA